MELRNVMTFLRVAELGSFTKAASELGYAQSTITVQIRQLEDELGVSLFDRIGKKIALTPKGEQFFPYANGLAQIASQIKLLETSPAEIKGRLRLGILESLSTSVFSDLIPQYHSMFPLINVEIKNASSAELLQMLRHNELDIIFTLDRELLEKDCIRAYSRPEPIVFVTAPENPIVIKARVTLSDIARQTLILPERCGIYRQALEEIAAREKIEIDPSFQINSTEIILSQLKRGLGVSFLPEYTVKKSVDRGELKLVSVEGCNVKLWSQILYHKNKWITPQMNGFIEIIRSNYKSEQTQKTKKKGSGGI